eukprot:Hpha_TRINITY_DN15681_c1_g5::TRINITY_DN15681_c1_g5_i3::g.101174::m.101174
MCSLALLELGGLLGTTSGVALRVRVRADTGQLSVGHNLVLLPQLLAFEVVLQDLTHTRSVTRLRAQRRTARVRRHRVVRHAAPRVVARRGLREPHVTSVPGELPVLERLGDVLPVADLPARGVHDVRPALHLRQQLLVEHVLRLRVQRAVDRHDVAHLHHALHAVVVHQVVLLLDLLRQPVAVDVVQLAAEGVQAPQHTKPNAPRRNGTNVHRLNVVRARDTVCDVPAPVHHHLVARHVVAHQGQDHHHHVLGHRLTVAVGHFRHVDLPVHRFLQVNVVRPDARRQRQLQLRRLVHPLLRHVVRPERLGDDDLRVGQVLVHLAAVAVFVTGHDELVAPRLEELAQAKLPGDTPKKLSGGEVDAGGRRRGLTIHVLLDLRHRVPGVLGGEALHRVRVQRHHNLGQGRAGLVETTGTRPGRSAAHGGVHCECWLALPSLAECAQ